MKTEKTQNPETFQIHKISEVDSFIRKLRKGKLSHSITVARETATLFIFIIQGNWWKSLDELLEKVRDLGQTLIAIDRMHFPLGNMVKRILFLIREVINDFKALSLEVSNQQAKRKKIMRMNSISQIINVSSNNLLNLVPSNSFSGDGYEVGPFKNKILSGIQEIIDDLDSTNEQIVQLASENVSNGDVLLTVNYSKLLESFLIEAAKDRKFKLYIAESAPNMQGEVLAKNLVGSGIETVIISDASVLSVMPKISKVLIGTRAIMANGGLVSYNGVFNVCLAAKTLSVPVVVVGGTFKLSPQYPFDQETFNENVSPSNIIDSNGLKGDYPNITMYDPKYDYVPPSFISIYITNHSIQNPAYIYRLFSEIYSQEDYFL